MISKKQAQKELQRREDAKQSRPIIDEPNFPKQNSFVNDTDQFIVGQCSRRAGKSNGLGKRFLKTMEKFPGCLCIYIAMTRDSAKDIMWPAMQDLDAKYNVGCNFLESTLTIKHPNGAKLKLYGYDMKNFVRRLRGKKSPGIAVDEAQDSGSILESLVDDVLTPMMADYGDDAWLAIVGTCGPVPSGYWHDITEKRKYGYSYHAWTLFENPYLPNPQKFLENYKKRKGWDDSNPTLKREWLNQWVMDLQSLWIQYQSGCNYSVLPNPPGCEWQFILGVDIGFKDADALAVVGWNSSGPDTYLVEETITRGQGVTPLVEQIEALRKKYPFNKIIMDQGGLGLKVAEEMRRRHNIPVIGAEKQRKQETVAFLNDAMRVGRFKAKQTSQFVKDSYLIQIDWEKTTPDRIVIKKQPHSDIIDAVIYAFKESPAYLYQKPVVKPKMNTKEWYDKEAERLEALAEEHFQRLEDLEKDPFSGK